MFGKLESTAAINTSGIGIGLVICKKIVEAYNGRLTIDDQDQRRSGTAFTFTIKTASIRA